MPFWKEIDDITAKNKNEKIFFLGSTNQAQKQAKRFPNLRRNGERNQPIEFQWKLQTKECWTLQLTSYRRKI